MVRKRDQMAAVQPFLGRVSSQTLHGTVILTDHLGWRQRGEWGGSPIAVQLVVFGLYTMFIYVLYVFIGGNGPLDHPRSAHDRATTSPDRPSTFDTGRFHVRPVVG